MKKIMMITAAVLALSGCGPSQENPPAQPSGGQPFLPAYEEMLRTGQWPQDTSCQPTTLQELLIPCDQP
jgi:hypothetical protein